MKFKVDENLPKEAAELLKNSGHDAKTINDQDMGGKPDHFIAKICNTESRVLLTLDTDFADIRTYPPGMNYGFIVLRLKQQDRKAVTKVLEKVIPLMSEEKLNNKLWIVDEKRIRIREE